MEKMELSDSVWYVFEDRFAISFFEGSFAGYTTIKYVMPEYKLKPDFLKLFSQTINLDLLSPVFLRSFVYGVSYPFEVSYSGSCIGKITTNSGYSAQDLGLGIRLIENIGCVIFTEEEFLHIVISVSASPVLPGSMDCTYSLEDSSPFKDKFVLKIPMQEVPTIFQMSDVRKKYFLESHSNKKS